MSLYGEVRVVKDVVVGDRVVARKGCFASN